MTTNTIALLSAYLPWVITVLLVAILYTLRTWHGQWVAMRTIQMSEDGHLWKDFYRISGRKSATEKEDSCVCSAVGACGAHVGEYLRWRSGAISLRDIQDIALNVTSAFRDEDAYIRKNHPLGVVLDLADLIRKSEQPAPNSITGGETPDLPNVDG